MPTEVVFLFFVIVVASLMARRQANGRHPNPKNHRLNFIVVIVIAALGVAASLFLHFGG